MDLEILFDPGRLFTFHLHLNLMLRNDFEKRLSPLLQIKKGDGQEMWRQDEKERLLSDVSFLFCLRFILLFVFYFSIFLLSLSSSPPLSLFFLSGLWSICDPDIHNRRSPSCVWASSLPRLLLFIPHTVLVYVFAQYGLYTSLSICMFCVSRAFLFVCVCQATQLEEGRSSKSWPVGVFSHG